jgi:putative DNA primase/helicase
MQMNSKLNIHAMKEFKQSLHGRKPALYQTYSKNPDLSQRAKTIRSAWNADLAMQLKRDNLDGLNVSMAINSIDGRKRAKYYVTSINAVFIDSDDGRLSVKKLLALPLPPHLIVETSEKNYHAYWRIKNCKIAQFSKLQKALAAKFKTDVAVSDLARAMRMPGTYNHKSKPPFLARIVHNDQDRPHVTAKALVTALKLKVEYYAGSLPIQDSTAYSDDETRSRIVDALASIPMDDRWIWLRAGMAIHSFDSGPCGFSLWDEWSRKSPGEKYDANDQRKTWDGFAAENGVTLGSLFHMAKQYREGGAAAFEESTLAQLFSESFQDQLRYDRDNKKWYAFNGTVWTVDSQAPVRKAKDLIGGLAEGADSTTLSALKRFRTVAGYRSIVSHTELLPNLQISVREFDQHPNIFAVKNGVINLVTGKFQTARALDFLRRQADVQFDAEAKCPNWTKFVRAIVKDDRDLYEYLRRIIGYAMFGHAEEQSFFVLIGQGSNGKGVLSRTLKRLFGDYGESVSPTLLTKAYCGNPNGPTPALVQLHGARIANCTELPKGAAFDEAFIKQYAGGDEITARPTYGDQFTFKPEGKLLVSTNHVPEIAADDHAMWRRMKVLPFNAVFSGENNDRKLEEKLDQERSGILNWMITGAMAYAKSGLGTCDAVERLESKMRKNADSVLAWISECCAKDKAAKTQASLAYESYETFMRRAKRKPLSFPEFRKNLNSKEFYSKRRSNANYYVGLRLRE